MKWFHIFHPIDHKISICIYHKLKLNHTLKHLYKLHEKYTSVVIIWKKVCFRNQWNYKSTYHSQKTIKIDPNIVYCEIIFVFVNNFYCQLITLNISNFWYNKIKLFHFFYFMIFIKTYFSFECFFNFIFEKGILILRFCLMDSFKESINIAFTFSLS